MTKTKEISLLLPEDKIAESFQIVTNELDKYEAISKSIKIDSEETLAIAENNIAQVKTLLIRLEAARDAKGRPYFETKKAIDQRAKMIRERLESYHQRMALVVTNWRAVQEAARKAEQEARQKELAKINIRKEAEIGRLMSLTHISYAKLYGGIYRTSKGEKIANGCQTAVECDHLQEILMENFPKAEQFEFFPERREKIFSEILKAVRNHKIDLMELSSSVPGKRIATIQRINKNKEAVGLAVESVGTVLQKKVQAETNKEIREGEKEIREAAKGTRKILKFKIEDEEKVTREFLSVDTNKIRDWMDGKSDHIKSLLEKGEQPISGIEFYVEVTYVAR